MSRFWKQGIAVLALAAAMGLWCSSPSLAAKPGGGTPAGTIYFRHIGTIWSIWSMKADGSDRKQFPNVEIGEPSYLRHGSPNQEQRWFVRQTPSWMSRDIFLMCRPCPTCGPPVRVDKPYRWSPK